MVSTEANPIEISIIIINYNSYQLIKNLLNSFFNHSKNFTFEIIIIDNGSVDESFEKLKNNFNSLIFIKNKKNLGFGGANNVGLNKASGKYILFLNNDTLFLENSIPMLIEFIESNNYPTIVGCKLLNKDNSIQNSVLDFPNLLNTLTSNFFLYVLFPKSKFFNKYHLMNKGLTGISEVEVITGAFILGKKEDFIKINGFDERFFFYAEEMDLLKRFRNNGGKVYYYPKTSIIHLKGTTAKKNYWFQLKNQSVSTIQIFQKHFYGIKLPIALLFHYVGILLRIPIFIFIGIIILNKSMILRGLYFIKLLFVYPQNQFKN